jgi:hypothetical protein
MAAVCGGTVWWPHSVGQKGWRRGIRASHKFLGSGPATSLERFCLW